MEKHHCLWEKRNYQTPLEKQVRSMSTFILEACTANHRLLHASILPPEKPEHEILLEMQGLAVQGLNHVIKRINDPIAEHITRQLEVLHLPANVALDRLQRGDYTRQ